MYDRTSLSATINGTADFLNSYAYNADQQLTMVQQGPLLNSYAYNADQQLTMVQQGPLKGTGPIVQSAEVTGR